MYGVPPGKWPNVSKFGMGEKPSWKTSEDCLRDAARLLEGKGRGKEPVRLERRVE